MRDPPARRDGWWLMTRLNPRRRNIHHPANERVPRLFLPPSWYWVVSHGVSGLQDEILSTDHDVSRHSFAYPSLSLSFSLFISIYPTASPLRSLLRFRLIFPLFLSPVSLSLMLSRAQSPISNDRARWSPQVDPTATHERSRSVQSRGSVHEGVRTAFSLLLLLHINLFTSSTVSESKTMDYTRECILHRREGERTNFQYLVHFPPFQRSTEISQEARITL